MRRQSFRFSRTGWLGHVKPRRCILAEDRQLVDLLGLACKSGPFTKGELTSLICGLVQAELRNPDLVSLEFRALGQMAGLACIADPDDLLNISTRLAEMGNVQRCDLIARLSVYLAGLSRHVRGETNGR
jgi:hypothetical protein